MLDGNEKLNLTPNKVEMIEDIIAGGVKPSYLAKQKLASYLWRYFVNECAMDVYSEETINAILDVMLAQGLKTSYESIENDINYFLSTHEDGKVCPPLQNNTDGINIYQSEVESIRNANINMSSKRTMLGLLILRKLENLRYGNNENRVWYYWQGVVELTGAKMMKDTALRELSQSGLLDIPMYDEWMTLACMQFDGEVAMNIKDNFYDITYWYEEIIVGKTALLAYDIKKGVKHIVKDTNRGAARQLSVNGHRVDSANIQKCETFQLLSTGGYFFVRLNGDLVTDEEYHEQIIKAYITANSRKRKIANIGLSATEYVKLRNEQIIKQLAGENTDEVESKLLPYTTLGL